MSARGPYWLTISETAAACGVSRDTVKRYHRAGKFPNAYRDEASAGRAWRFPVGDLMAAGLSPQLDMSPPPRASAVAPAWPDVTVSADHELRRLRGEVDMLQLALDAAHATARAYAAHISDLRLFLNLPNQSTEVTT